MEKFGVTDDEVELIYKFHLKKTTRRIQDKPLSFEYLLLTGKDQTCSKSSL